MKRFTKAIGKLPFSGRMSIAPKIFALYNSTSDTDRKSAWKSLTATLVLYIICHGLQAWMGISGLWFDAPLMVKIVFGVYAVVNVCVSITQIYLLARSTAFLLKSTTYPSTARRWKGHTGKEVLTMTVVTLGGQIIFMACYIFYQ